MLEVTGPEAAAYLDAHLTVRVAEDRHVALLSPKGTLLGLIRIEPVALGFRLYCEQPPVAAALERGRIGWLVELTPFTHEKPAWSQEIGTAAVSPARGPLALALLRRRGRAGRPGARRPGVGYRRAVSLTREQLEEHQRHVARRKEPDAPLTREQEHMLKLQSGVGNAAIARAMLNRQLPDLVPRLQAPQPMEDAIKMRVVAYLEKMRLAIQLHNQDGTISMPELVNQVRQNVPEALAATPFQIEMVITEVLAGDTPPPVRKVVTPDGRQHEVAARILNSIPKPPKELALHAGPGTLTFAFAGEAKLQAGPVALKADKDGASATVKGGDASVTAQAAFAGDSVGLKASVKGLSFDAQLRKGAGNDWSKFAATVKIPIGGDETVEDRPPLEEITAAVVQAEAAINEVVAHLAQGGSPTDEVVKSKMALIKPAFEKVGEAVEARKGPQAGLKLTVGTGDPKLGSYGVVSLVVEF